MAYSAAPFEVGIRVSEQIPAPYAIENEEGRGPFVIVVDHASNAIPAPWGDLGLSLKDREAHIAWDPGALEVAREMSRLLDAPLVAGTISRLVVDLNRPVGSATFAPAVSEATDVPGNRSIAPDDMALRVSAVYEPYHAALAAVVARQADRADSPVAVLAMHSFTPVYKGVHRPLHVGILFDRHEALGRGMIDRLTAVDGIVVAANEPYSPADEVYFTLTRHAVSRGLLAAMIEVRNDELRTPEAQARWGGMLASAAAGAREAIRGSHPLTRGAAATSRGSARGGSAG